MTQSSREATVDHEHLARPTLVASPGLLRTWGQPGRSAFPEGAHVDPVVFNEAMGKRGKGRLRGGVRIRRDEEWIGGLIPLPRSIQGPNGGVQPSVMVWMDPQGMVVGQQVVLPGQLHAEAAECVRKTMRKPMHGPPRRPAELRVESADLADALQDQIAGIPVFVAPTPELEALAAGLEDHMGRSGSTSELFDSLLAAGASPASMGALFEALAAFYEAIPWTRVPGSEPSFALGLDAFGWTEAVAIVLGQHNEIRGYALYRSLDDYDRFIAGSEAMQRGEKVKVPAHLVVMFEQTRRVSDALRKNVARNGWKVAHPDAFPLVMHMEGAATARVPNESETHLLLAATLAMLGLLDHPEFDAAWNGGQAVQVQTPVRFQQWDLHVRAQAPALSDSTFSTPTKRLFNELERLSTTGSDPERERYLEEFIFDRFHRSPEAYKVDDVETCPIVHQLGKLHLGSDMTVWMPSVFRRLIFDIVPAHASFPPDEARAVIEQHRAFIRFLKREVGLEEAEGLLKVLGGSAVRRLEERLGDASRFGMAKSIIEAGRQAGHDVESVEGIQRWMEVLREGRGPSQFLDAKAESEDPQLDLWG